MAYVTAAATLSGAGSISLLGSVEAQLGIPNLTDTPIVNDLAEPEAGHFRHFGWAGSASHGVIRNSQNECQVVWQSGLTFKVFSGTVVSESTAVTVAETNVTCDNHYGSGNPRYDLIVVNRFGVPTFRKGADSSASGQPAFPLTDQGDVLLGYVYINGNTLSQAYYVDMRIFVRAPITATTAVRDLLGSPPTGFVVYNSTVGSLQVNVGTAAAPNWASYGGSTISGGSTSGNLTFKSNDALTGSFVFAGPTPATLSWASYWTQPTPLGDSTPTEPNKGHAAMVGSIYRAVLQQNIGSTIFSISGQYSGDRITLGGTMNFSRSLFSSSWYPATAVHGDASDSRDGLEDLLGISVHGQTDKAHYTGGDGGSIGYQHQSFYHVNDNYTDLSCTLNAVAVSAGTLQGTRQTIVVSGDQTAVIKGGEVLLIYRADKVLGRDNPANGGGTYLGGFEYVYVIPTTTDSGKWGNAGAIVYGAPNTSIDVFRGWWSTPIYHHPIGNKIYRVLRYSNGHYINAHTGPSTMGRDFSREAYQAPDTQVQINGDWLHISGGGFGFTESLGQVQDYMRDRAGGFEYGKLVSAPNYYYNTVQTWGHGNTHGSGGYPKRATALRLTGHDGTLTVRSGTNFTNVSSATVMTDSSGAMKDSRVSATGPFTVTLFADSIKSWSVDFWRQYSLVLTGGTGSGQTRTIVSNNVSALTIQEPFVTIPDTTTSYEIRQTSWAYDIYAGYDLVLTGGTGSGQTRKITTHDTVNTLTVVSAFSPAPDTTTNYVIKVGNHGSTLPGTMFYRQDQNQFKFRDNTDWYSVALMRDIGENWDMGSGRSISIGTFKTNNIDVLTTSSNWITYGAGTKTMTTTLSSVWLDNPQITFDTGSNWTGYIVHRPTFTTNVSMSPGQQAVSWYDYTYTQTTAAASRLYFYATFRDSHQLKVVKANQNPIFNVGNFHLPVFTYGTPMLTSTTASSGTTTTVVKTGAGWTTNQWQGLCLRVIGGTNNNSFSVVTANSSDTIGWTPGFGAACDSTTVFECVGTYTTSASTFNLYETYSAPTINAPGSQFQGLYSSVANLTFTNGTLAHRGGWTFNETTGNGALTNQVAFDVPAILTKATGINAGIRNASNTIFTPSIFQTITTGDTTISANASIIQLSPSGTFFNQEYIGTLPSGQPGQLMVIRNVDTKAVTFKNGVGGLTLNTTKKTLKTNELLTLLKLPASDNATDSWFEFNYNGSQGQVDITKACIPKSMVYLTSVTLSTVILANASIIGAVSLLQPMNLTHISVLVEDLGASATISVQVYNEAGVKVATRSTGYSTSNSALNVLMIPLDATAYLAAGIYWVRVWGDGTNDPSIKTYTHGSEGTGSFRLGATGTALEFVGTSDGVGVAGPTTIDPASLPGVLPNAVPYVRFDGI